MAHWADDQVTVTLQRHGGEMEVRALQESTGVGPEDLEACLTGLVQERSVVEADGAIRFIEPDDRSHVVEAEIVDDEPVQEDPTYLAEEMPVDDALRATAKVVADAHGLSEAVADFVSSATVIAECELTSRPDGSWALAGVRRIVSVE